METKQKLYTEEQVRNAIRLAKKSTNIFTTPLIYSTDEVMKELTPIYLLTDEEIGQEFKHSSDEWEIRQALEIGAKWLKEQILNQNK